MKPIEYSLVPTALADDAVDVSMTESPNTSVVQSIGLVFMDTSQLVTGSTRAHGASYADDEGIGLDIDDAYNYSVKVKRLSSAVYVVDEPEWHNNHVTGRAGAYARVVRGIRQIATGAMLSTADLFIPTAENNLVRKDKVEMQQHRSWLHKLHLAEPSVPCPPIRFSENHRILPPAWDNDDDELLAFEDASFLFVEERR